MLTLDDAQGMIATYAWVAGGEIPSQRLRSYTFGLAAAVGFFFGWLTSFTAPYFINPESLNWGPKYGYIWFPSCMVTLIWVYLFLPETKGRTLEEIDEMVGFFLPDIFSLFFETKTRADVMMANSSRPRCRHAGSRAISAWAGSTRLGRRSSRLRPRRRWRRRRGRGRRRR